MHEKAIYTVSCFNLPAQYCWLIQIESQCQPTASVNSVNAECQATNIAFTCAGSSIHVDYELALQRWLENQVSVVYLSAVAEILSVRDFKTLAQFCGPFDYAYWDYSNVGYLSTIRHKVTLLFNRIYRHTHCSMTYSQNWDLPQKQTRCWATTTPLMSTRWLWQTVSHDDVKVIR